MTYRSRGEDSFVSIVAALLTLVLFIPAVILNGVVLKYLWAWHVSTTFGVEPLSVVAALGLSFTAQVFIGQPAKADKESRRFKRW